MNQIDKEFLLHFEKLTLKFKVRNTDIAERWYKQLLLAISRSDFCEKDRVYNFGETLDDIMNELLYSAEMINLWDPIIDLSKIDMNHLHKYFEIMRGNDWPPAKYFTNAPARIREHIERFNILIHKIESFGSGAKRIIVRSRCREAIELQPNDYHEFTTNMKFGTVYINYCHVGKPLYDVFKDNDEIVGEHNIVPQSKYSSDMNIFFSDSSYRVDEFLNWFDRKSNWLNSLGFYKDDPKIALGAIPVADLITDMDRKTIIDIIAKNKKYLNVTSS